MRYSVSDDDFIQAVTESFSIRQVLIKLEMKGAGGNYSTVKKRMKRLNLDTSHFTGQLWNKGRIIGPTRPIMDYLTNKAIMKSHKLKQRLIQEQILPRRCYKCMLEKWLGNEIPLELHHIDGDHENNFLLNLQLLCPNCHTLTDNYRGKKLKKTKRIVRAKKNTHKNIYIPKIFLCICGKQVRHENSRCKKCIVHKSKINWPSVEDLLNRLKITPYTTLGKELGVSDNAIRKHLKNKIPLVGIEPTLDSF